MLEPYDRRHLMEALRPPEGYSLDYAIGTTYSLDLLALLTAPLAFKLIDWDCKRIIDLSSSETSHQRENKEPADISLEYGPLALFEALREYSSRIKIFCHAGNIHDPGKPNLPFYPFLEQSVIEVLPDQEGGSFHPKVWLLRYFSKDKPIAYRLLCLSRNLTFDRSWDTALVLDGILADRKRPFAVNHPLGDFIKSLPKMATREVSREVKNKISQMQDEIRRVNFEPPEGLELIKFWPLGLNGGSSWPFSEKVDKLLVVSPFLSKKCLSKLVGLAHDCILISRLEELQTMQPEDLSPFSRVFYLSPFAAPEKNDDAADADSELEGLHAKIYVADRGWDSTIWTGSANATDHAFGKNIEFMIELKGKKSKCGIEKIMSIEEHQINFRDLLVEFPGNPRPKPKEHFKMMIEESKRKLAKADMHARASPSDNLGFNLYLEGETLIFPAEISICCWPITKPHEFAKEFNGSNQPYAAFSVVSNQALTSFFAFQITAKSGEELESSRFVLNLPLEGAPERTNDILEYLVKDEEQLIRFMLLMLSDEKSQPFGEDERKVIPTERPREKTSHTSIIPLFECMVQALAHDPSKIDEIKTLIDDLSKNPKTDKKLPEEFESVWGPIWSARMKIKHDDS
jgi:hypothetical protein